MSDTVIRVENLGKRYRIGLKEKGNKSLKEQTKEVFTSPFKYLKNVLSEPSPDEVFWALKDVSFEVKRGEVLGVIGRNGAGKSTLLKILSRITEPTKGFVEIRGRVGSLLEVGTGFHPDLTGRENTYLNGTIMGMKKREIDRRFDEIVDFAEVEKFIDTPVKHYSSGMYTRLAFAVAAHLEPEILIVDEVLSVGDVAFQKKCLGKIKDISQHNQRTVIFVSHDMNSVSRLCSHVLYLKKSKVSNYGSTEEVINFYLMNDLKISSFRDWSDELKRPGNEFVELISARVIDENYIQISNLDIRRKVGIEINYKILQNGYSFTHGLNLYNEKGVHILSSHDVKTGKSEKALPIGVHKATVWVPGNFLAEGTIIASIALMKYNPYEVILHEQEVLAFNVVDVLDGSSARGMYGGVFPGAVRPLLEWNVN